MGPAISGIPRASPLRCASHLLGGPNYRKIMKIKIEKKIEVDNRRMRINEEISSLGYPPPKCCQSGYTPASHSDKPAFYFKMVKSK